MKLADVNRDGRLDAVTGWEEGGLTRICLQPERSQIRNPWPAVTVGSAPAVEDAVFADLDADGGLDVVSCCEGKSKSLFVHWAPSGTPLEEAEWETAPIPVSRGVMQWMQCEPVQLDGRFGVDLLAGGKGNDAAVGWFEAPADPRELNAWRWHPIGEAGWIMSLLSVDMDGDGDEDALLSDRKGNRRGCRWLENPGLPDSAQGSWTSHMIGARDREAMFLDLADWTGDGQTDIACSTARDGLWLFARDPDTSAFREHATIPPPKDGRIGKGVAAGDIDLDGRVDLVWSFEQAVDGKSGVVWLSSRDRERRSWSLHELSGPEGIKFDQVKLLDLDGDEDLDVLTCEEREVVDGMRRGLGLIWYENPVRSATAGESGE